MALRLLVVGSLPPPIGGATVSLLRFVETLRQSLGVELRVIDTAGGRRAGVRRGLGTALELARAVAASDVVSVHVSPTGLTTLALACVAAARALGRPVIVRVFGGGGHTAVRGASRLVADRVLRGADLYLVETKALVARAREDGFTNVRFFPNTRPRTSVAPRPIGGDCRRFVFVSHIKPSKGVLEIIEAGERFGNDVTVDVYGTFHDGMDESVFRGLKRVRYCGVVQPENLASLLVGYDAVLLPSYHAGEGYAGIVIDAFGAGLPVICSRWLSLPEIVDESCGQLVPPKSADALFGAMSRLVDDAALFEQLTRGAHARRDALTTEIWTAKFIEMCREIVDAHAARRRAR